MATCGPDYQGCRIYNSDVELLIETDNGEMTIGAKRNILLDRAIGDYVCFIDDDDMVPDYYVEEILRAIGEDDVRTGGAPDAIGIKGHYFEAQKSAQVFIHSIQYDSWFTQDGVFYRPPNHLNPVKRELALKAGFPEKDHGEDHDYSMKMLSILDMDPEFAKTEVFIDKVMYFYHKD